MLFVLLIINLLRNVEPGCSGDFSISKESDIANLNSCSRYNGKIRIENFKEPHINIPYLEQVDELIIHENSGVTKLLLPNLKYTNNLEISNHTDLYSIDIGNLKQANSVELMTNPKVRTLNIGRLKNVQKLVIEDMDINSIDLPGISSVNTLVLNANKFMSKISFPDLDSVKDIFVAGMNWDVDFSAPKLKSVTGSATINSMKSIDIKQLNQVKIDLVFDDNKFTELSLPNLNLVEGTLRISNNNELKDLDLSGLEKVVSTISIEENQQLKSVKLPSLSEVRASFRISGDVNELDVSNLNHVGGSFNFMVNKDLCSKSDIKALRKKVKGKFQCIKYDIKKKEDKLESSGKLQNSFSFILMITFILCQIC